jgi:hypothetical protein
LGDFFTNELGHILGDFLTNELGRPGCDAH